jgi:hypothetical protein
MRLASAGQKRPTFGRHVLHKAIAVGAVEVRGKDSGRARLQGVPDVSARSLTGFVSTNVARGAIVVTDGWGGYDDPLPKQGYRHRPHTRATLESRPRFCLASIVSSGTSSPGFVAHLQAYLDEVVFRFNGEHRWPPSRRCPDWAASSNPRRTQAVVPSGANG